ncbi:ligand-binding sensor domain-containing protein [Actinocorallia populi]|uniref:hypothetical protein n=1 Tax=Actinocorallia populi TaxID=2079200 RepID=UPI00130088FD|nr:hypothetical protein [Actinocorallia populi]
MAVGTAPTALARRFVIVTVCTSVAVTTVLAGDAGATPRWRVTENVKQRIDGGLANFDALTAVSPKLAWSVLGHGMGAGGAALLRWDGTRWNRQEIPEGIANSSVSDLGASSRTNLWLAGQNEEMTRSYVAHWDGRAWGARLLPEGDTVERLLVRGAKDVWYFTLKGKAGHYDGKRWRVHDMGFTAFSAVASGAKVWAVGGDTDSGIPRASVWNGRKWKSTRVPGEGTLYGVTSSAGRIWTAGMVSGSSTLLRWNGKAWKKMKSPHAAVKDLVPDGSGGLWASSWPGHPASQSGIYHFKKGRWSQASIKGVPDSKHPLAVNRLVRIPRTKASLWAVGGHDNGETDTTALIMKCGS